MATDVADSSTTSPEWLRVAVWADSESVESVSELFGQYGYNQGVVVEEQYRQDDDGDHLEIDPLRPVRVSTYLALDDESEERLGRLRQGLWHLRQLGTVSELEAEPLRQSDWENSWKEYFQVTRIGRRIVIKPSWREYEPQADDIVVEIDPGVAFGTGLHPSTRLCLHWLEEIDLNGKTMADVGAGSGILSIAGLKLGATRSRMLEVDPMAVKAMRHNLDLNHLADRATIVQGDAALATPDGDPSGVVVANMISSVLLRAKATIAGCLAPGGHLVLSGIIETHELEVAEAFEAFGLRQHGRKQAGDWVSLLFVLPARLDPRGTIIPRA